MSFVKKKNKNDGKDALSSSSSQKRKAGDENPTASKAVKKESDSGNGHEQEYGFIPPSSPLPLKRVKQKEIVNPCSGRYEGQNNRGEVEIMVDIDKTRKYAKALNMVSGTINARDPQWTVKATSLHFKAIGHGFHVSGGKSKSSDVSCDVKVVFSDGTKSGGTMELKLYLDSSAGTWKASFVLDITGQRKLSFENIERRSLFFKEINMDVYFTEKLTWPTVELIALADAPFDMKNRVLDPSSAFEDAGLKLIFDRENSQQVEDPMPRSPWTKSDLYEVMTEYFIKEKTSKNDIWCMIGATPPDKRCLGFSFNKNSHRGFGLFIGHKSFEKLEHDNAKKKAQAQCRLLHYLVQECGHCLGLRHSFEIGAFSSLSWMNYAWRYDIRNGPGSFDRGFNFSFSNSELMILRHAPGKAFKRASSSAVISTAMGSGYNIKYDVPDSNLADDDDDNDVESGGYGDTKQKLDKPRPMRKIVLDLKVPSKYSMGQLLSFEARLKNKGKLPALIEGDLSIESGNLRVYITKPDRNIQAVEPFVRPIYCGYSKPKVLYTPEDEEGTDRYSQQVSVGAGSDGHIMDEPGQYEIRAAYNGGRYNVTSESYLITVVDDNDEDKDTSEEVLTVATLQSSSSNRFQKTLQFWNKLKSHNVMKKKSTVATLIALLEGMADKGGRYAGGSSKHARRGPKKLAVAAAKPALSREQLLEDTDDLVKYYQEKGTKEDNFDYTRLVLARGKLYAEEKNTEDGGKEVAQLVLDITHRGVRQDIVKKVVKKWKKFVYPPKVEERYTPENLQNKVNSVLRWVPTTDGNGEPDLSGIGLGNPFSSFNHKHRKKANIIIDILFNKYDETQDIYATINYADKLQKGREVNSMVLEVALEAFTVHSVDAKKAGIRYPEPEDMEKSNLLGSAIVVRKREGMPDEQWMNYWRCDADYNYHHRHWHVVYALLGKECPDEAVKTNPELAQEGQLFGYMHEQLVARYDAERESWGLEPVKPWDYDVIAPSFDPGLEFDRDPKYSGYVPRPITVWPQKQRELFMRWEHRYKSAVTEGNIGEKTLTSNLAGHILEPSSAKYESYFGGIHNDGHDQFGKIGIPEFPKKMSCMGDTKTAARDFIFYRWHKRIDNLFQEANDKFETDIISDAPPVTITADDIILSTDPKPPAGFESWNDRLTQSVTCLKTFLGPPTKKFELDNKLSHEKFYYHLRIKRNPTSAKKRPLPLTIRIFICPKKRQAERTRWIEMDKFVCKIEENQNSIALTRADVHSAVIKRLPKDKEDDFESKFTKSVPGWCECGWPYSMLLPRGKKDGEDYVLFVMATDNNVDNIWVHTQCGSMSYCGASDLKYPDARSMGYPFSSPIFIDHEKMPIPHVFDQISNATYKTFKIQNDVAEPTPMKGTDVWWPSVQLGVDDGTVLDETTLKREGVTDFIKSNLTGIFRVLINDEATAKGRVPNIMIRFQGRGPGGGPYVIRDVQIALRDGQSDKVKSPQAQITHHGEKRFIVPEVGLISDAVSFILDPALGDYFVDFTLESPGVYLPARQDPSSPTSTFYQPFSNQVIPWRRYADIWCISGIMATEK